MNLAAMLMKNEESEDIAVTCRGQSMTYNGLSRHVRALAASVPCQEAAIGIWMDNSIFYLEAYFAIIYSGNIVVPLRPKLSGREIRNISVDCGMKGLMSAGKYRERVESLELSIPVWYVDEMDLEQEDGGDLQTARNYRLAVIIPTSGTTGNSKYVQLSHEAMYHSVEYISRRFLRREGGKEALLLPFCSILAQAEMLHCISCKAQIILTEEEFDPHQLCDLFEDEKITSSGMVPSMLKLFGICAQMGKYKLDSLERIFFAGDYLSESDFKILQEQLPKVSLIQAYGMTEISPISMKEDDDFAYKPGSAGKTFPELTVRIRKEDGAWAEPGCVGEIYAGGPNLMEGYLHGEELLPEGMIGTGDMGYLDEEGYLFICGRKKNIIISAGQNIYPEEVEAVLQGCPGIKEVMVYGQKSKDKGEIVAADIVPEDEGRFDRKAFYEYCRQNMAVYKIPVKLCLCEKIAKTATDKKVRK